MGGFWMGQDELNERIIRKAIDKWQIIRDDIENYCLFCFGQGNIKNCFPETIIHNKGCLFVEAVKAGLKKIDFEIKQDTDTGEIDLKDFEFGAPDRPDEILELFNNPPEFNNDLQSAGRQYALDRAIFEKDFQEKEINETPKKFPASVKYDVLNYMRLADGQLDEEAIREYLRIVTLDAAAERIFFGYYEWQSIYKALKIALAQTRKQDDFYDTLLYFQKTIEERLGTEEEA